MGRGGRDAEGPLSREVVPEPIIGDAAIAELVEILDYIAKDSPRNAQKVSARITREIGQLARTPEGRPVDEEAPDIPDGATARKVTVSGYSVRYLYPLSVEGEPCVLVVSIRRGNRKALEDPAYLMRWIEERAKRAT